MKRREDLIIDALVAKDVSPEQRQANVAALIHGYEERINFNHSMLLVKAGMAEGEGGRMILRLWLKKPDLSAYNVNMLMTMVAKNGEMATLSLLLTDPRLEVHSTTLETMVKYNQAAQLEAILVSGRRFAEEDYTRVLYNAVKKGQLKIANLLLQYHDYTSKFITAFHSAALYHHQDFIASITESYQIPEDALRYLELVKLVKRGDKAAVERILGMMEQQLASNFRGKILSVAAVVGNVDIVSWCLQDNTMSGEYMYEAITVTKNVEIFRELYLEPRMVAEQLKLQHPGHYSALRNVYEEEDAKLFEVLFEKKNARSAPTLDRAIHLSILGKYNFVKVIFTKAWEGLDESNKHLQIETLFVYAACAAQVSIMTLLLRTQKNEAAQDTLYNALGDVWALNRIIEIHKIKKFIGEVVNHDRTSIGLDQHLWIKSLESAKEKKLTDITRFVQELYTQEGVWAKAGHSLDILPRILPAVKQEGVRNVLLVCKQPSEMLVEAGLPRDVCVCILSHLFRNNINWPMTSVSPIDVAIAIFEKSDKTTSTTQPAILLENLNLYLSKGRGK